MALEALSVIDLDTSQPYIAVVHGKQYDTVRQVEAHLYFSGVKWYVPASNIYSIVSYRKSNRIGGFYDMTESGVYAITVDGDDRSIIYIALDRQVLTTPGDVQVEITFYDTITNGRLSGFAFTVDVEEAAVQELDLSDNPSFQILAEQISAVLEAEENLTGLTATASKIAPGATPTTTVSGGSQGVPYNIAFGIPTFAGITASSSKVASTASPTVTVTGGTSGTSKYNLAFGIPQGNGVSNATIHYGTSLSETTLPTSWVSSVTELRIPDGSIMWTRVVINYEDGTSSTYYTKALQGTTGPAGVSVQTTEPMVDSLIWIDPDEQQTIVIPDIKDLIIAADSTYSSRKIENTFLAYGKPQALTSSAKTRVMNNLGFTETEEINLHSFGGITITNVGTI